MPKPQTTNALNNTQLKAIADEYGTPTYVYCADTLAARFKAIDSALQVPHIVCYAVKASSNIAILSLLAELGCGFDIVSQGELLRCQKAKARPELIMFSGVAKTKQEIAAALKYGVGCLNVESLPELERIQQVACDLGVKAPVALRINPDIDANTHPYIATGLKEHKFGIAYEQALAIAVRTQAYSNIVLKGLACHIGSQIADIQPYEAALDRMLALYEKLTQSGLNIETLNMGGGMGICYDKEPAMDVSALCELFNRRLKGLPLTLVLEPGRFIIADAGVLLTHVEYIKEQNGKRFAIVDAGMNDLIRPALYESWHDITNLNPEAGTQHEYDIVGPVCETSDFLGLRRHLVIQSGDILAVNQAGAYGFSMASHYNSRPKAAEVLVSQGKPRLIRRRENLDDLTAHEEIA